MSRWDTYGKKDSPVLIDGDPAFRGIDMVRERASLAPGILARSENKRLRNGSADTRSGSLLPSDFNPQFVFPLAGSDIYSNPNGEEVMLVAESGTDFAWAFRDGKDPRQIGLAPIGSGASPYIEPTGIIDGSVNFVQAFDKVFLLRNSPSPPLVWDGLSYPPPGTVTSTGTDGFRPVTKTGAGTIIPSTTFGLPFQNRILLYNANFPAVPWRDQFVETDILDYTKYDPILGTFRINAGASELLMALFPYDQGRVLVFMQKSIHMVSDFTGDDPTLTTQQVLSSRVGSGGFYTIVQLGGDVVFLDKPGGIYRLTQSVSSQILTDPIAISEPIQPIIDQIDWDRALSMAGAAALKQYLYFLLPLIGSEGASNAIVVYNGTTNQWESAPDLRTDEDFHIDRLLVTLYQGAPRLFAVDYANSRINLLYEGVEDQIDVIRSAPVHDVIETRGYVCGNPGGFKNFSRAVIGLRTNDPQAQIVAITDGFNEEKELAVITKDATRSYVHGKGPFTSDEPDPGQPYREDYSVIDKAWAIETFENLPDGPLDVLPGTDLGPFVAANQQSLERYQIRDTGRWVSLRIDNTQGRCDVLGTMVEGVPTEEGVKVVV